MATTVVSGRIDEKEAAAVSRFIEKTGKTWNSVINSLASYIYEHQRYPWAEPEDLERESRQQAFQQASALIEALPRDTFIDTMSDADMHELLARRSDV